MGKSNEPQYARTAWGRGLWSHAGTDHARKRCAIGREASFADGLTQAACEGGWPGMARMTVGYREGGVHEVYLQLLWQLFVILRQS